jgi:hypothetical protein
MMTYTEAKSASMAKREVNRLTLTFTRPANTNTYDAGDVCGAAVDAAVAATPVLSASGSGVQLVNAMLMVPLASLPSGMTTHDLHIYNAAPAALADEATWVLADADRASYLGKIQFASPTDLGGSLVSALTAPALTVALAPTSVGLWFQLVTTGGYAAASATAIKVFLTVADV